MATKGRYNLGIEEMLGGTTVWSTAIRAAPTVGYTFAATDDHWSDISVSGTGVAGGVIGATGVAIATPTKTDGVALCDPITWTAPTAAQVFNGVLFYKHNATASLATLLCWIGEDSGGTALAFTTNGSDVIWTPNPSGVFSL